MVKVRNNLIGKKFGMLTVIGRAEDGIQPNGQHRARWLCQCDCGSEPFVIFGYSLNRNRNTLSCGCLTKEVVSERSKKNNIYNLSGEYGIGYASNTGNEFYFDLEDYDKIKDYCWYENSNGYMAARMRGTNEHVCMHVVIGGKNYDHADRNKLNNTKQNLRSATYSENCQNRSLRSDNSSGVTGVWFSVTDNKWIASLDLNGETVYTKKFNKKYDAIVGRLNAEKKYFGEFAPQQHLYEQYDIK